MNGYDLWIFKAIEEKETRVVLPINPSPRLSLKGTLALSLFPSHCRPPLSHLPSVQHLRSSESASFHLLVPVSLSSVAAVGLATLSLPKVCISAPDLLLAVMSPFLICSLLLRRRCCVFRRSVPTNHRSKGVSLDASLSCRLAL
ncbi:hypothetical protein PIB30_097428 [Stylosanthes scabra]|uniref:Uncharacterized protein n=1 Tax=Stylosanthes scabra TaxID=79078 RepID=A0ABU6XWK4_9FABA|nr:hypothetical protein [Stylosanthes scabra]